MSTITLCGLRATGLAQRIQSHASKQQQFLYLPSATSSSSSSSLLSYRQPQQRFASTSNSSAASILPAHKISKVNGPPTTLPAPLILPERDPSKSLPGHLLATGKSYLTFYKTGVKNIYHNFIASRPIQAKIDNTYSSSLTSAASSGTLTRSDFQLLVRNWHDIKRVPVFALVFLICGEFTPLVVVALSGVVPWTCRIPKQIDSDRRKLERRRAISFRNLTMEPPKEQGVDKLERMQLLHISWSLGLSSSIWDYLGGKLPGLPTSVLRRRVKSRIEYLELDDMLILKSGGVKDMDIEEVRMALVERGINTLERKEGELRADLGAWLRLREGGKGGMERFLLVRPSVWPTTPAITK